MYRWCDEDEHSYYLGVWNSIEKCMKLGKEEITFRGNKYGFRVYEILKDGYRGKAITKIIDELGEKL